MTALWRWYTDRIRVIGAQEIGDYAMKSQYVRFLLVSFLLVCGMIGCGEKNAAIEEGAQKAAMEEAAQKAAKEATAAQEEQERCSQSLRTPIEVANSIEMKFRLIPAGEFMMGSPESDDDAASVSRPQHKVRITKPFYLGVYEVTQAEYEKVMGENPSKFKGATNPVERVSWDDAVEFCKRLSTKEGKTYRLPTEAEWEYACRAGTTTEYTFGDDPASLVEYAWDEGNSDGKTHAVGEKKPNAWGLYDMHGNVCEWCADWYAPDYYAVSPTDDPPGPQTASHRVGRGGSWYDTAGNCVSSLRFGFVPSPRSANLGFRVAADLSDTKPDD